MHAACQTEQNILDGPGTRPSPMRRPGSKILQRFLIKSLHYVAILPLK